MKHGTTNAYNNQGCRCEPCRQAWAIYRKELRKYRRKQNSVKPTASKEFTR